MSLFGAGKRVQAAQCRHNLNTLPRHSQALAGLKQSSTLAAGQTILGSFRSQALSVLTGKHFDSTSSTREYYEMPVATYGVAADRGGDRSEAVDDVPGGESSALLGEDAAPRGLTKADGHAALTGSIGNLANTIIGSGTYLKARLHKGCS